MDSGEKVIRVMGLRLWQFMRRVDGTALGLGGEDMVVLLRRMKDIRETMAVADALKSALTAPIDHNGRCLRPTLTIGAVLARPGEAAGELVGRATQAMEVALQPGGHQVDPSQDDVGYSQPFTFDGCREILRAQ